jgi:hypothetical protein
LGDALVFFAVSAEPVIAHARTIRALFPEQQVICVGYTDGICGYLPTSEMLREGGLEVDSPGYGLEGARYYADVSQKVLAAIRPMSRTEPPAEPAKP